MSDYKDPRSYDVTVLTDIAAMEERIRRAHECEQQMFLDDVYEMIFGAKRAHK